MNLNECLEFLIRKLQRMLTLTISDYALSSLHEVRLKLQFLTACFNIALQKWFSKSCTTQTVLFI